MNNIVIAISTHKNRNIGPLLRNSVAFGCQYVAIIGSPQFSTHGAHGSQLKIQIKHFYTWNDFKLSISNESVIIYGLSPRPIANKSSPIRDVSLSPQKTGVVFCIGSHEELSFEIINICDEIIHLNFQNEVIAEKVNYECKLGIVLQIFLSKYTQLSMTTPTEFMSGKFHVNPQIRLKGITRTYKQTNTNKTHECSVGDNATNANGSILHSNDDDNYNDNDDDDDNVDGVCQLFDESSGLYQENNENNVMKIS